MRVVSYLSCFRTDDISAQFLRVKLTSRFQDRVEDPDCFTGHSYLSLHSAKRIPRSVPVIQNASFQLISDLADSYIVLRSLLLPLLLIHGWPFSFEVTSILPRKENDWTRNLGFPEEQYRQPVQCTVLPFVGSGLFDMQVLRDVISGTAAIGIPIPIKGLKAIPVIIGKLLPCLKAQGHDPAESDLCCESPSDNLSQSG